MVVVIHQMGRPRIKTMSQKDRTINDRLRSSAGFSGGGILGLGSVAGPAAEVAACVVSDAPKAIGLVWVWGGRDGGAGRMKAWRWKLTVSRVRGGVVAHRQLPSSRSAVAGGPSGRAGTVSKLSA